MSFNSADYGFADQKISMLGAEFTGFRGLKWKKAQDKEAMYAQGNEPKAIKRGNKKYTGTLTLLQSDVDNFNQVARAAGYEDYIDVPGKFITLTSVYENEEGQLKTDVLINLEFTDLEEGQKQGDKFGEVSMPFLFLRKKQS